MAIKITLIEPVIFTGNPAGVNPAQDLRASDNPNIPAVYTLEPGTPSGSRLIATLYTPIDTVINLKGFAKINLRLVPDPNDPTDVDVQLGLAADTSEVYNVTMRIRIYVLYDDNVSPPPMPGLLVQPHTLSFTTIQGTNPAPQAFTITNTGNASLNLVITEDANGAAFVSVTLMQSTLAPGQSTVITVAPSVAQVSAGIINALITVADSDPGTTVPSQQVTITLIIQAAPILAITPTDLMSNQSCQLVGVSFVCPITLTNTSQTAGLTWTSSANLIPSIAFQPPSGTLAPGQAAQVEVSIAQTDCTNGANIVFTGPGNSVVVPWQCSPPIG
jgi:hypothetical protein